VDFGAFGAGAHGYAREHAMHARAQGAAAAAAAAAHSPARRQRAHEVGSLSSSSDSDSDVDVYAESSSASQRAADLSTGGREGSDADATESAPADHYLQYRVLADGPQHSLQTRSLLDDDEMDSS